MAHLQNLTPNTIFRSDYLIWDLEISSLKALEGRLVRVIYLDEPKCAGSLGVQYHLSIAKKEKEHKVLLKGNKLLHSLIL